MVNHNKSELIKSANDLGFSLIKIAKSRPLDKEFEYFQSWINNSYNASMNYLSKNIERRQNPSNILKDAKSVIMTAINYYVPKEDEIKSEPFGKISRYAWGDDYHTVIKNKLNVLVQKIDFLYKGSKSIAFVDSGPILEKQWAQIAGIGWQGKNSIIITREFGSCFFLGTIITTAEIEPDSPAKNYCGTCRKCIDACPTGAIVEAKVVDASKCITYCNIETQLKYDISDEIINKSDNWIYGCDICQQVCPWNKFQQPTSEESFSPKNPVTTLTKEEIENMDEKVFQELFGNKAIKRLGLKRLKRNSIFIS